MTTSLETLKLPSFKNTQLWYDVDKKVMDKIKEVWHQTGCPDFDLHYLMVLINNTIKYEFKGYQENNLDKKEKEKKAKKAALDAQAKQFTKKSKYEKPQCTIDLMKDFFQHQFSKAYEEPEKYINWEVEPYQITTPFNMVEVTEDEFNNILDVSCSDSRDRYGMSYNILKRLPRVHIYLRNRYSRLMKIEEYVPDTLFKIWTKCIMGPQYKRGSTNIPSNFRPIIKFPIHVRIFNRILSRRLVNFLKANNMLDTNIQKGIIDPYNGVYNHVRTIREIMHQAKADNRSAVITFLDIKNAYGSIDHRFIEYMMKHYHIPIGIANYIVAFYQNTKGSVKMNQEESEPFELKRGLHQGSSLSNVLFLMAMNIFLTRINTLYQEEKGFQFVKDIPAPATGESQNQPNVLEVIKMLLLAFVDDVVVITDTMEDNKIVCKAFSKVLRDANIFLNYEKIRYLTINCILNLPGQADNVFKIDSKVIKEYL